MTLVHKCTGISVKIGDKAIVGDKEYTVIDFEEPKSYRDTGKVHLATPKSIVPIKFYVSMADMCWIGRLDRDIVKDQYKEITSRRKRNR